MVMSMTGFGRAEISVGNRDIIVEMKSVNHRYFEFSCRTSRGYSFLEDKLKKYVGERISRGKVDMYVSVTNNDDSSVEVELNKPLASGYIDAMKTLADEYGITNDTSVSVLSRFNDIFQITRPPADEDAVFADVKVAVDEETVRLRSHFDQMKQFLGSGEPVGRKLDFIVQEMNREANTIGSKVNDSVLAHKVVDIKGELEKIREQVQNIE